MDDKKYQYLSEEDLALKQKLDLYVERLQDTDSGVQKLALESMRQEIQASTSSITSVPKPLKFLRPHYSDLLIFYEVMLDGENKKYLADIISVLALTMAKEGERTSLKFRLLGSVEDIGCWGHGYVRNLVGEISHEFQNRQNEGKCVDDLLDLINQIVPFHMKHNAELEAVDLLLEVDRLDLLIDHINKGNYKRTCAYLTSFASHVPDLQDTSVLDVPYFVYMSLEQYPDALRVALRMDRLRLVEETLSACRDALMLQQLCYILARQGIAFRIQDHMIVGNEDKKELLQEIINNAKLSEGYLTLARDLEIMEPKSPEDIYKVHLMDVQASSSAIVYSAWENLAATFVNAFVNAGFGQDKLMTPPVVEGTDSVNWLSKNKEHGKISATASLGLITLWNVDDGLPQIDKYLCTSETHILAGALLGVGVMHCGMRHEYDPAYVLLYGHVESEDPVIRISAIIGLGLAYAGTDKEEVFSLLGPLVTNSENSLETVAFAALSLGIIYAGSCNYRVSQTIITALMERSEAELLDPLARFLCLGLGLLYLGKMGEVAEITKVAQRVNKKIAKYLQVTLELCAYAGTGNVLLVQKFLGFSGEHTERSASYQSSAVLGIALVAMTEEIGLEMAIRSLQHILQYGERHIKRTVPLALGILSISNPKINIMDILSRLSHDGNLDVATTAIFGLGLIGAGTNNARIARMLHSLSSYYYRSPTLLFCIRIAQGLVHMGKGLLSLSPYHSDRFLLSRVALSGLITVLHAFLDMKYFVFGKYHYVLYFLALAMQPRMLTTLDENLRSFPVPVRVGQAVDVVGQAGSPKTITGFRTLTTPVLLASGERAELATEKYIPLSSVLEGFVILKENPDYEQDH